MNGQLIYEPRGRAREYAALACNIYRGCDHRCIYCYAPSATFRDRDAFGRSESRGTDFLERLAREAQTLKPSEPILLCFTCDPYQALDAQLGVTREAIKVLHSAGHQVHILTKGGSRALRDTDLLTARDAFATTLTTLEDAESHHWEPGAALPGDRIATIKEFHRLGIPTWVSLEPVLHPAIALEIIRQTHTFVNLFKVGRLNYHPLARQIDWSQFALDAVALLKSLRCRYYLKRDLAVCLPQAQRLSSVEAQPPRVSGQFPLPDIFGQ